MYASVVASSVLLVNVTEASDNRQKLSTERLRKSTEQESISSRDECVFLCQLSLKEPACNTNTQRP